MQLTIHDRKFTAQFDYDDIEHSRESIEDRRERILHARFGDKPVVYPPWPKGGMEYHLS